MKFIRTFSIGVLLFLINFNFTSAAKNPNRIKNININVHGERKAGIKIKPVGGSFYLGEGPHWDENSQKLFFVDILDQRVNRYDPKTGSVTCAYIENGPVGMVVPVNNTSDQFVAGSGTDFVLFTWDHNKNETRIPNIKKLLTVDSDRENTRWNDGKVDSSGVFWGGTMAIEEDGYITPNQGSLYRITDTLVPERIISPISIGNGIAWNPKNNILYYIDSPTYQIVAYDYDSTSGKLSNKRVVFDVKKNNIKGLPDGMTIDTRGNLWIALFSGKAIIQINPRTGKLLRKIEIPSENVTSVAFGGAKLNTLYVTTARHGMKEDELKKQRWAGYVFAIKGLGVRGFPANRFNMKL